MNLKQLREFLGKDGLMADYEEFLCYFDGQLYWEFTFISETGALAISANTEAHMGPHPAIETVITHCGGITSGYLTGPEPYYAYCYFWRPGVEEGCPEQAVCTLTKTPEARLSLWFNASPWDDDQ